MCQLTGLTRMAPVPPYRQIADILKRRILSGQTAPDSRIPTESELGEAYEVARTTARRAVGVLRDEGLVYTVPQRLNRSFCPRGCA